MLTSIMRLALVFMVLLMEARAGAAGPGIVLLAHGGSAEWNARVTELAQDLDRTLPVEVAFGMATRRTIQEAVDKLNERGVDQIVAVPLFVSSWSSVITSSEYLLGLSVEAPKELAIFARMDHGKPASGADSDHAGHESALGSVPVTSNAPIVRMTSALNDHPIVAQILTDRARAISRTPTGESVIVVAHGPVTDDENARWLGDINRLGGQVKDAGGFASVDALTVRDDAPKPIREAATAELRALVSRRIEEGRRVLIVPLLLSYGGIERGIVTRLDGLDYTMSSAALMPDPRIGEWVLEMAAKESALTR
jgi:sirohydrochlorin cobaltochelatase